MDSWARWRQVLMDPEPVWQFQSYFGIQKVFELGIRDDAPWVAQDHELMPKGLRVESTVKSSSTTENELRSRKHNAEEHNDYQNGHHVDAIKSEREQQVSLEHTNRNIIFYKVGSYPWFLLFHSAAQLGHELFFILFFVFTIWNVDGSVGRKIMLTFNITMYSAQALKDWIGLPRPPMPHVVAMEGDYSLEFGMPSTHAMNTMAIVSSTLYFTCGQYDYPLRAGIAIAVVWVSLVCCSRLYLGMHTLADILAGLLLSSLSLNFILPLVDCTDKMLVTSTFAPLLSCSCCLLAVCAFPRAKSRWTPSWGDATQVAGTYLGVQLGYWTLFQAGWVVSGPKTEVYHLTLPSWSAVLISVFRFLLGGLMLAGVKTGFKPLFYRVAGAWLKGAQGRNLHRQRSQRAQWIEVLYKFFCFFGIGYLGSTLVPASFVALGCERPSFFEEL